MQVRVYFWVCLPRLPFAFIKRTTTHFARTITADILVIVLGEKSLSISHWDPANEIGLPTSRDFFGWTFMDHFEEA